MAQIGDVYESAGETTFEWIIKGFSTLSEEINTRYESPKFYFSGTSWVIWMYPNGEAELESEGYIGIYVLRMSTGFPLSLNYSLDLKIADGKIHPGVTSTKMFKLKQRGWGASQVMLRSTLNERKSELTPSDTLTVICTLKNTQLQGVAGVKIQGIFPRKFYFNKIEMSQIGNLREYPGETTFEWEIVDFFSLSNEKDVLYESPKFYFSGASWQIWLYPNGEETRCKSNGWIALYITRKSSGSPISLNYSLGFKTFDGRKDPFSSSTMMFCEKGSGFGASKFISRSVLMEKKSELTPSDVLTVICILRTSEPNIVNGSLFSRLQAVSDNLSEIYLKAKKADFLLKTDDRKITAHRMILETRSPVFAAMLNHDTKENRTGEVLIEDVDSRTMNSLLLHMYSGDIDTLTRENALSLYVAAEKYDIKAVKEMCSEFIMRNLSVEWVLEVIKFAELYQDKIIGNSCKEYFKENADKILETANWDTFVKENHGISVELLATVVKSMFKKGSS